jgi:hypothetical protein
MIVMGETPIACHLTIRKDGEWVEGTRQCAGAARFRANVCKSPRDPSVREGCRPDHERVFSTVQEFNDHHG